MELFLKIKILSKDEINIINQQVNVQGNFTKSLEIRKKKNTNLKISTLLAPINNLFENISRNIS